LFGGQNLWSYRKKPTQSRRPRYVTDREWEGGALGRRKKEVSDNDFVTRALGT